MPAIFVTDTLISENNLFLNRRTCPDRGAGDRSESDQPPDRSRSNLDNSNVATGERFMTTIDDPYGLFKWPSDSITSFEMRWDFRRSEELRGAIFRRSLIILDTLAMVNPPL